MLGFTNVHLLDFAPEALTLFSERVRDFPKDQLHYGDFFEHQGKYDLVLEQTLFCAINPNDRKKYAKKMADLIKPSGKLVGVLFNREFEGGPPFGGSIAEYEPLFSALFSSVYIEPCYNSIKPREGSEVFIKMNNVQ
jgi:SAM-dependent methyltransferase